MSFDKHDELESLKVKIEDKNQAVQVQNPMTADLSNP